MMRVGVRRMFLGLIGQGVATYSPNQVSRSRHMTRLLTATALLAGVVAFAQPTAAQPVKGGGYADKPTQEQVAFFEKKIRPVLVESCYKCHPAEAEKIKGGLTLDTRDGMRSGGDS